MPAFIRFKTSKLSQEVIPKLWREVKIRAKMSHLVFLPAALLLISSTNAALKDDYDHSAYLDVAENFKLYWSVKDADKSIHFATEVNTAGWVGFGISAGLSGSMKGADIAMGWVDSTGNGHLKVHPFIDRHCTLLHLTVCIIYLKYSNSNLFTINKPVISMIRVFCYDLYCCPPVAIVFH